MIDMNMVKMWKKIMIQYPLFSYMTFINFAKMLGLGKEMYG